MNNQESKEQELKETGKEIVEEQAENLEQKVSDVEEASEATEEAKQEVEQDLKEGEEKLVEIAEVKPAKNTKGHDDLVARIDATKEQAEAVYEKYQKLDKELEDKASALVRQENNILKTTIANTLAQLKELQVEALEDEKATINEIKVDNKEQLLNVKYPSKGRFGALFFGGLTTVAGVVGAFAYGTKLANIPLSLNAFLDKANWNSIALKYGELINIKDNAIAGYVLVGVASLIIGAIVYKISTILKASKNKKYVTKLENDLNEYVSNLEDKSNSIKELIEHTDNIKLVMQKYDIILQEQNAKLKRMLFIEQPQSVDDLQRASKLEVDKTVLILDELLKLMNTPVSEDITIKPESQEQLKEANSIINEVIKKLYI